MKTIYLCGPINGRSDDECIGWREQVKAMYTSCLDPMRRDYRGQEMSHTSDIVEGDMEDIRNSDVVLVFFDRPSVGTAMEVFYAKHVLGKRVIVIDKSEKPLSPWLVHHADAVFKTIEQAVQAV